MNALKHSSRSMPIRAICVTHASVLYASFFAESFFRWSLGTKQLSSNRDFARDSIARKDPNFVCNRGRLIALFLMRKLRDLDFARNPGILSKGVCTREAEGISTPKIFKFRACCIPSSRRQKNKQYPKGQCTWDQPRRNGLFVPLRTTTTYVSYLSI